MVVHVFSYALAAALGALWLAGLHFHVATLLAWMVGIGALLALGDALIDRDLVDRSARAFALMLLALGLYQGIAIAWHTSAPAWYLTALGAAASAAFVIALMGLAEQRRIPPARTERP